jgi:hypothetical protein
MGVLLSSMPVVKKGQARVPIQTRAPVFGGAAASRERVLDHLSDKEKEDECPPSQIRNLRLIYAVLAAASL